MNSASTSAVGLLGGTFDPVHIGHLRGAIDCRERLGLDRVILIPAGRPPLKDGTRISAEHRTRMVELAVQGEPDLAVDRCEVDREGTSFTVDTLAHFRSQLGRNASLTFIVGTDTLQHFHRWRDWRQILELANLAVMVRPDETAESAAADEVAEWLAQHRGPADTLRQSTAGVCAWISQTPLAVSSTAIRETIAAGKSCRFLLPEAVIKYIVDHELYIH